jgi:hypothetical protein
MNCAAMQRAHQRLVHTGLAELEAGQVAVGGEAGRAHLVRHGAHLRSACSALQQLTRKASG